MSEQQLLRDPGIAPTPALIAEGLGAANDAYVQFLAVLPEHGIDAQWRYYNDGKAWLCKGQYHWTTARGTAKETTAFWLSVWEGFVRVTLFIPEKYRADALALPLGDEIRQLLADAKQMGKLKFFPLLFDLRENTLFEDAFALIDFRKMLK